MEANADICVGVDVGGTFTDCVVSTHGRRVRAKSLTSTRDLSIGVIRACEKAATRLGLGLSELLPQVCRFGLGTTAVTNMLAAGTGRRVGLVTTKGFEDLIPLSRGYWENADGWLIAPRHVVDRRRIVGVDERIDRDGRIVRALDAGDVVDAARHLVETQRVEALAVSFLWSFRNPTHEEAALAALTTAFPGMSVTTGASQLPVMREYERTMFALLNAYAGGALDGIDRLTVLLAEAGLRAPLLLVHSGGGAVSVPEARQTPIALAESGPSAGVAAALRVARTVGVADAVTCDMGGTTFDVSIVHSGEPLRRVRGLLMGVWTALSSVDIQSVGAGGGSVAWVDALGMLRVGPTSAGSNPGPACYGRGGTEATVTDAMLVLGYLAPDRFLGGEMTLDLDAATDACARLGGTIGVGAQEAAWGIREVALAGMVSAVRGRLAEFGLEAGAHSIISYGGSGGLFCGAIGAQLGSPLVVVPEQASVLSAWGAATVDLRRERSQSVDVPMPADPSVVVPVAQRLCAMVEADLDHDGAPKAGRRVTFEADMRFQRQKRELIVSFSDIEDLVGSDALLEAFRKEYVDRFGEGALTTGAQIELAVLRAVGVGLTSIPASQTADAVSRARPPGSRLISLDRRGEPVAVPAVDWASMHSLDALAGPALIDARDTTVWVPSDAVACLESPGILVMRTRA